MPDELPSVGPGENHSLTVPYPEALQHAFAEARGEYRLCLKLASGSTGTIYLAMYRGTDGLCRPVVIKRIHSYLANRLEFVEMFFNEAQIAASIDHPAVCALYDFGRTKDTYFLAMEYLVGETFEQVTKQLRTQRDSVERVRVPRYLARLAIEVCEGLQAVHEASDTSGESLAVVHGDITLRNLFALYDGSARVTDFGSAFSRDQPRQHAAGVGKGKLAYMSPEQLSNGSVDRRSDVWSLGVVLWEMLTLVPLFAEENVSATVRAVRELKIEPPSSKNPVVPQQLDRIVIKALQRDPKDRYNSARELAVDLELFLAGQCDLVGPSDLTAWLERLFPAEAERRREAVRVARSMVDDSGVRPPPLRATSQADAVARAMGLAGRSNDNAPRTSPAPAVAVATAQGRDWGRIVAIAALVIAALLLVGAYFFTSMSRPHESAAVQGGQQS
jgi:eukaryotic-like serine/threonine-protein kinase